MAITRTANGNSPGSSGLIPLSIVLAKGDILVATGPNTVVRLPVGTSGQVLSANPATATGLTWSTHPSGTSTGYGTSFYGTSGYGQ